MNSTASGGKVSHLESGLRMHFVPRSSGQIAFAFAAGCACLQCWWLRRHCHKLRRAEGTVSQVRECLLLSVFSRCHVLTGCAVVYGNDETSLIVFPGSSINHSGAIHFENWLPLIHSHGFRWSPSSIADTNFTDTGGVTAAS